MIEEELAKNFLQNFPASIDFEILSRVLIDSCSWTMIELESLESRYRSIDIINWCQTSCVDVYKYHGKTFLFKSQGDAVNFSLRWA
jgi:hypothetical protein